ARDGGVPAPPGPAARGAPLGWVMQLHMSWPLLLPFIAAAFYARAREGWRSSGPAAAAFLGGFVLTGAFILPTWMTYGSGGTGENVHVHWREPISTFFKTLARLLAFSSYEINRFIGTDG